MTPIDSLHRQLRITQLTLACTVAVLIGLVGQSCAMGPTAVLRVSERLEIGDDGELVLTARNGAASIAGRGFILGCLGGRCQLAFGEKDAPPGVLLSDSGSLVLQNGKKMIALQAEQAEPVFMMEGERQKVLVSGSLTSFRNGDVETSLKTDVPQPRLTLGSHSVPAWEATTSTPAPDTSRR